MQRDLLPADHVDDTRCTQNRRDRATPHRALLTLRLSMAVDMDKNAHCSTHGVRGLIAEVNPPREPDAILRWRTTFKLVHLVPLCLPSRGAACLVIRLPRQRPVVLPDHVKLPIKVRIPAL